MLILSQGSIFEVSAEALVNPVNCVGVSGRGLALLFKQRFPENFRAYQSACARGEVCIGKMFVTQWDFWPKYIINFPTKRHWRDRSQLEWIEQGLINLKEVIEERSIPSVAIPALGCGLGGLKWQEVYLLLEAFAQELQQVKLYVFPPH